MLTKMYVIQLAFVVVFLLPVSEQQQSPGEPVSLRITMQKELTILALLAILPLNGLTAE